MNIVGDEDDVLELLTGEDDLDADIDEVAEEELLRDDMNAANETLASGHTSMAAKHSVDDEEEDEEKERGRERFKSERIMSLASVPTRRREIPDSLDMVKVNIKDTANKDNSYNRRRHKQQKYRHNSSEFHNSNRNSSNSYRSTQGLLPIPMSNALPPQPQQPSQPPQQPSQQRLPLFQSQMYNQPAFQQTINNVNNNSSAANSSVSHVIHVNPHFRARAGIQFEQLFRPQEQHNMRVPNIAPQSRPMFMPQQQNPIDAHSSQLLINQQIRQNFIANNAVIYEQQYRPPNRSQPQQQQLLMQPQSQIQNQVQLEQHWRSSNTIQPQFSIQQNPISLLPEPQPHHQHLQQSHQMNARLMNPQVYMPTQPQQQSNAFMSASGYAPNFQTNNQFIQQKPLFHQQNNSNYPNQYADNVQRFPLNPNVNQMQFQHSMPFPPQQQTHQQVYTPNNRQIRQQYHSTAPQPQRPTKPLLNKQQSYTQSQPVFKTLNKSNNDSQKMQKIANARKAAALRKQAKHILTKSQTTTNASNAGAANSESLVKHSMNSTNVAIEAEVGVDEEYKKKMEEQKRLREVILRKKEERRKAMASQRLMESEAKSSSVSNAAQTVQQNKIIIQPQNQRQTVRKKVESFQKQSQQQQISTLVNRAPQLQQRIQTKAQPQLRVVKTIVSETDKGLPNKANNIISAPIVANVNQKRSVLINGLASTTTELTIKKLCKLVGPIESCKISSNMGQRSAVVTFLRSQDAVTFQTKHERTLLDLSIIQVSLTCL